MKTGGAAATMTAGELDMIFGGITLPLTALVGSLVFVHKTIQKQRSKYQRYKSLCKLGTDCNDVLDQFYCTKDKDIFGYLCELKAYGKEKKGNFLAGISSICEKSVDLVTRNNEFKYSKMYYMDIFELFYKLKDDVTLSINDETIKRIAFAYILAEKILESKVIFS